MPLPAATQAAAWLWTARSELHTDPLATTLAECMTPPAGCVRRFTWGRVRDLKNGHNSVTVQNRTHVYMNFFHHKDLGNHLLQLCPKVMKHPVCGLVTDISYTDVIYAFYVWAFRHIREYYSPQIIFTIKYLFMKIA